MSSIVWKEDYATGIAEIDEQHQNLFKLVAKLDDARTQGTDATALSAIFNELMSYVVVHFETEERYFYETNYPDAENHKQEHQYLTDETVRLQIEFESGKANISDEVMTFLNNWWTKHILEADQKYAPHIRECLAA